MLTFKGFGISLLGATSVHMEKLFGVSPMMMSWSFTSHAVGLLVGTVGTGFVYERVNHELLLAVVILIQSLLVVAAPFTSPHIYAYIAVMAVTGIVRGLYNAG